MEIYAHLAIVICYLIAYFDRLPFINHHHMNTATAMIAINKTTATMIVTITPVGTPKIDISCYDYSYLTMTR